MGYAEKLKNDELQDDPRELCPEGTYVFKIVHTMIPKPDGSAEVAVEKHGDAAGIPIAAVLAAPLADPDNAKSAVRDLAVYRRIAVPFEAEGVKVLTKQTYLRTVNRLRNLVGDRLPPFDWKDKEVQQECLSAADELAVELFCEGGHLNGCIFIAECVHTKSDDGRTFADLRGIRQTLGDATLTDLKAARRATEETED